jgi:hypothetical protein
MERLIAQAQSAKYSLPSPALTRAGDSWFRRWWPALVPAGLSLACAVVLAVQQSQIRELKQSLQAVSVSAPDGPSARIVEAQANVRHPAAATDEAQEIARLKTSIEQLTAEISQLEKLSTENQDLRTQLATPGAPPWADKEFLDKARERKEAIECVNNMKQFGLAVALWAGDNANRYPTDIICMSNVLATPKILVCPGDHDRVVAQNFGSFTMANCSFEWFLTPASSASEPNIASRVLVRCPIHGHVLLYDGSVQMGAAKKHPEGLVQRDGKLYFEPPQAR